ncbi:class I SAM-dependent methyltransferase [Hankyongella ginsenosidimutans]|uniref:class I SAM-dependent methyltransferase n=1 Tax=Hankyongella ginsenosidimutans TaxID=1763828 RepID=UPI001FE3F02A|nr:class I SAM-dependent methyltransferase [Hankyongella ginsenosidimutans]
MAEGRSFSRVFRNESKVCGRRHGRWSIGSRARRSFHPCSRPRRTNPFYDRALRVFTREQRWRLIVTEIVAAARPQTLLDVGCGTGTLLAQLAHELPRSSLTGLDPDENVLALAQEKARAAGTPIEWGGASLATRQLRAETAGST